METLTQRLFLAIEINKENQQKILALYPQLQKYYQRLHPKWVTAENLHLTLRFLGNVESKTIPNLVDAVKRNIIQKPFTIEIAAPIIFPSNKPRMLALKVHLSHEIASLYVQLNQVLDTLQFNADDRPFLPHITLARARQQLFNSPPVIQFNLKQPVESFSLFASSNINSETHYPLLNQFPLR